MPGTQDIVQRCDELSDECDHLLTSVDTVDFKTEWLRSYNAGTTAGINDLSGAQTRLGQRCKIVARRVFWSGLRPSVLSARLLGTRRPR